MSKKCKITININGVPHVIEDSILSSEDLDQALSIMYYDPVISNLIINNELKRRDDYFENKEDLTKEDLVRSGYQGNYSFKTLINEFLDNNSDSKKLLKLLELNGFNISDYNIIYGDNRIEESSIINAGDRSFFLLNNKFIESDQNINKFLLYLYYNNSDNSVHLTNLNKVYDEISKKLNVFSEFKVDNTKDLLYTYLFKNITNIILSEELQDKLNEAIVNDILSLNKDVKIDESKEIEIKDINLSNFKSKYFNINKIENNSFNITTISGETINFNFDGKTINELIQYVYPESKENVDKFLDSLLNTDNKSMIDSFIKDIECKQ